jgi:uncharacterized membrane protein YeaQ/YmgE (transglycosylase-associated protein family)
MFWEPLGWGTVAIEEGGLGRLMGIVAWIIFGLIAGLVARWLVPGEGPGGVIGDIIVGIIGAILGGWIYRFFGHAGVTGFNLPSIVCAIVGAIVLLFLIRAIRGRPAV